MNGGRGRGKREGGKRRKRGDKEVNEGIQKDGVEAKESHQDAVYLRITKD